MRPRATAGVPGAVIRGQTPDRSGADRGAAVRAYRYSVVLFALIAIGIGFALLVVTAFRGGWVGFVLGALFIAYGAGRFALMRRR
jgi:hypothetical protein